MRWLAAILIAVHGLIHLMGFARAFGLAEVPGLSRDISGFWGTIWLLAALALLGTALLLVGASRLWWTVGLAAVVLSQAAIVSSWEDARYGTLVNLLLLLGVLYGFASEGPWSLREEYRRGVDAGLASLGERSPVVTEDDVAHLPEPIRRFMRVTGSVGLPRPQAFRATWTGRIRSGPDEAWMSFTAEQHNFVDDPSRLFLMKARKRGLPVDVLHVFRDGSAGMRARLLSLLQVVDARGAEMTRAETVTLFNDLCLLAPGALVGAPVRWEPMDSGAVRGRYTAGRNTVEAVLRFNEAGELVDFVSDDRLAASPDGSDFVQRRWSTPVTDYRDFEGRRAPGRGEGWWHPTDGADFAYIEAELTDLEVL